MNIIRLFFLISILPLSTRGSCIDSRQIESILTKAYSIPYKEQISILERTLKAEHCPNVADSTIGKIYDILGKVYFKTNHFQKAIEYGEIALEKWEGYKNQRPANLDYIIYNLAYYYHLNLNYTQAIKYYKKTINQTQRVYWKGYCHKLISDLAYELGDYDKQILELEEAEKYGLTLTNANRYYLLSDIYNARGMALSRFGNHSKSIEYLELAKKNYFEYVLKTKEQDENLLANIYINLCSSYNDLGIFGKALKFNSDAEVLFKKNNQPIDLAHKVFQLKGLIYNKFHFLRESNIEFNKAIAILKTKKSVELSRIYLNFAFNLKQENKIDSAIRILDKAIEMFPLLDINKQNFSIIRSKRTLFYILREYAIGLSLIYQQNRKPSTLNRSLQYFSHADHLLNLMRQEHQGQQSKSFWREHSRSLYESAIEACYLANDTKKAFYFLEKSRAMLLLDDLKENHARQLLSIAEQTKEKNFQQKLLELQIQLENKQEKSTEYQQIIGEIASVKLAFSDFKKDLEKRFPEYYTAKYNEDFKDLATLQKWLKTSQHQAFISYFVGDSATYAMKITPLTTKLVKLPKDKHSLSAKFINLCADINALNTSFSSFLVTSNQLYRTLIKPVGLDGQRIIISYDNQFLPFEALSRSAKKADFLVEYHAISYAYSANFLLKSIENKNRQSFPMNRTTFLGVAPVRFSHSLPIDNLLLSGQSIQNIENTFNGRLLLEGKATKDAFIKQFPDYELVQLYTHADTTQKGPVFYLQDAPMYVSEIRPSQPIKTELILLSACKTGLGKNIKGEGVFSLSRGFSALGVPALITTLWSVDEKATYRLTELFHKYLKKGLAKDLALQKAKQEFIQKDTRNILPTLWASSILIGDTSPINDSNWWLVSIVSISILSSGLFLFTRFTKKTNKIY